MRNFFAVIENNYSYF